MIDNNLNLLDIPWIPAGTAGGTEKLTLADTFGRAGQLKTIGHGPPTERNALLRFLIPLAAVMLRQHANVLENSEAANDALEQWRDKFYLFDTDRPFMQEWYVTREQRANATSAAPVSQLHVHTPGGSSATWCVRPETRDAAAPSILPMLIAAEWCERASGNTGSPSFYAGKKISGVPQGRKVPLGTDRTYFFYLGDTVADTLKLNIPQHWLTTQDLPVWLDQDFTPDPAGLANGHYPLWRYTWTPNRPVVLLNEDGAPTRWVSGMTGRSIPAMGGKDVKENSKLTGGFDQHTAFTEAIVTKGKRAGEKDVRRLGLTGDLRSTQGVTGWYRQQMHHMAPGRDRDNPRLLDLLDATGIAAYSETRDKNNTMKAASWVQAPLELLAAADSDGVDALLAVADACTGPALKRALAAVCHSPAKSSPPILAGTVTHVFASLDPILLPAFAKLAAGRSLNFRQIATQAHRAATDVVEQATAPFATPVDVPVVEQARDKYSAAIRKQIKPLLEPELDNGADNTTVATADTPTQPERNGHRG